jgi:hypothetical protein
MIHINDIAVQQYAERVRPCSYEEAVADIMSHERALQAAADFGIEVVRCPNGERLVLEGDTVVSVYSRGFWPPQCRSPFLEGAH